MAVLNYFTGKTSLGPPALPSNAISAISGVREAGMQSTVAIAAANDDGSTFLLFQDVPFNAKFKDLLIENDAFTAGSSYSIGLADPKTGTVISAACLASALDLSTAHTKAGSSALDGLAALTHEQTQQCLWEIAGETFAVASKRGRYDVIITATTIGSTTGKITGRATVMPAG